MTKQESTQLTDTIFPINYNLFFEPDLKNFKFAGKVEIEIKITKPTSKIILHSSELKIKNASLLYNNKIIKTKIKQNKKEETITLGLNKIISNKAAILFEFEGKLTDTLAGFYKSQYTDEKGNKKYIATTQFEAHYARKAFPCFDEPNKKATFSVSLKIPSKLKAISNMPILLESQEKDKKIIKFDKTPLMSTYLLYIGVGEFEFIENKLDNIQIRIATIPGKSHEGEFALDLTKKFLKYFQDYSQILYPLPKLDLLAIPDFAAGAMENWGAITFREILLLFDPEKTSTRVKKKIAEVIAHELWHQWSGNLVTMKWWNDLWLNESFATYMAYKAIDHYFPEWKVWEDFLSDETIGAFEADALKTTHSIEVKVKSPNEIEEIFDEISYGKGGSVLRMIESYLGGETFRKGVSNYLKKYQYKNAIASDLWDSLAEVSDVPIKEIMESWIKQKGHPIIEIEQKDSSVILNQKRFSTLKNDTTVWKIPLIIKTSSETKRHLLTKNKEKISIKADWLKLNAEQEGFYRVKYSKDNLQKLKSIIEKKQLSIFDRWGIQNDLYNLTLINNETLDIYLDFIKSYENEDCYLILSDISANMRSIYFIFSQEKFWPKIFPKFKQHIKKPFENTLKRLNWNPIPNEKEEDALLRPLAIAYLAFIEDQETIKTSQQKFNEFLKGKSLPPDLSGTIYSVVARNGDKKIYESLINEYRKINIVEEKIKLLSSLYRFKQTKILKTALDFSLTKDVRIQDLRTVFAVMGANPEMIPILFNWIKSNWRELEKFKKTHFVFITLLKSFITLYTGKEKYNEIKKFLDSKNTGYEKTKANAFEIMDINTKWLNKNKLILENYFR